MFRKTLVLALMAGSLALGLVGCNLYFGPDNGGNGGDCGLFGCDQPPLGEPGSECATNSQCMAGCYCSEKGVCEEAGFCETLFDCPEGFECETERASCVPAGQKPDGCTDSTQCGTGWYCEASFGECVPSWTCRNDEECGPGWECNSNYSCQPMSCTADDECMQGCICDESAKQCVETGFCMSNRDCPDGMSCDLARQTCTDTPNPGSCVGDVTCSDAPPVCDAGSYPGIINGCYTGFCIAVAECDILPCVELTDDNACFARNDCSPVYRGVNCRDPNGNQCSSTQANCMCERFVFDSCETE